MNHSTPTCLRSVFALAALSCGFHLQAQTLLLDFGATTVQTQDATLSMGHFAGAVPETDINWNKITTDTASGLVFADGTVAAGVSVELGRSDAGASDSINFNNNIISSSALGGQENMGVYTNTSPTKDGVFASGSSGVNTNAVGLRVDGLAAGPYTIYIAGRNTSTAVTAPQRFFCGSGASASTFGFSTNANAWVDQSNTATPPGMGFPSQLDALTSTFGYGNNCAHLVVTIGEGESLYLSSVGIAPNEFRGFLNAVEIVPGAPVLTNFPAMVVHQPAGGQAFYEGASLSFNAVTYAGVPPLFYQWRLNGMDIDGETGPALALSNVTASMSGDYTVLVSNAIGSSVSASAPITVVPLFDTGQMSNVWNLLPGDRFYITTTDGGERGLAYNPATSNLLVVTHVPTNNIVVLDPATGAEKHLMRLDGVPETAAGMNMVGVGDDGIVYTCGVTANAGSPSTPFNLIWWTDDGSDTPPSAYGFSGDPGLPDTGVGAANLRWGDSFVVRGSGTAAQMLCGPGSGTNVCLFTTFDGYNFNPNIITVTNEVPSGFAQHGVAFGPGTNTFWAKTLNQALYLVEFDLGTGRGAVVYSSTNVPPGSFRFISTDAANQWMAGVMRVSGGLPDNVRLYDISDYTNGLVLADQELYTTNVANSFLNGAGVGSTAFGGGYLFALDSNNGLKAFAINTNLLLAPFSITSITPAAGGSVILTWPSVAGHTYQVQSREALSEVSWSNLGLPLPGTGGPLSFTNNVAGDARYYRVEGQ